LKSKHNSNRPLKFYIEFPLGGGGERPEVSTKSFQTERKSRQTQVVFKKPLSQNPYPRTDFLYLGDSATEISGISLRQEHGIITPYFEVNPPSNDAMNAQAVYHT
jgi:hypothetical protein